MDAKGFTPHYEFGFGLSYTTFAYSALSISSTGSGSTSQLVVKFTVANTGTLKGTEIPQLYLAYPAAAGEPKRVLRGFEEVVLDAGASKSVSMTVAAREMRCVSLRHYSFVGWLTLFLFSVYGMW
jgi:beta-glucosidase